MVISEAYEAYRSGFVVFAQSKKTEEQLIYSRNSLIKCIGDIQYAELTVDHVRLWIHSLLEQGLSPTTVKGYGEKLKLVVRYTPTNLDPKDIVLPKRTVKTPKWLTAEQISQILDILGQSRKGCSKADRLRIQAIIAILYSTGLRITELCQLNKEDIDKQTISIIGKNQRARLVFVDNRAKTFLELYSETRKDDNPALITGRNKKRITPGQVQEMCRKASRVTGIKFHPHTFRHSFATNLLGNKCHIYTLQRLMGHADISTTSVYLHIKDPELEEAHKKYHTT